MSLNKTAKALQEVAGISILKDGSKDEIKDMTTLIEELAVKWETLSDYERAGLSEAIAGAEQASVFQSLMQNLDVMKQVQQELANGDHYQSMEQENARYVDSIAGQLNKLKETWTGVFTTLVNSDSIKNIVKGLVAISEKIADLIIMLDETGMLTPVLMGLGTILASKAFTGLPNLFRGGSQSAEEMTRTLPNLLRGISSLISPMGSLGTLLGNMGTRISGAGSAIGGFLGTAAKFAPWAIGGAVAVGGLIAVVDHFTESLDEEKDRLNETISARKQEIASVEEQKGKLQELQKEYDKLSTKPKKTSDEVERLAQLTNEIAQIRPDLVIGTDETGNAILSLTGSVKDLIEEMDRANESKKKLLSVEQNELAKNSIKQLHGSTSTVQDIEANTDSLYSPKTEMGELENLTKSHISNMNKLEAERDKILNELYESTGKERQKLLKDLDKANYNIEKEQSNFNVSYQQQLDIIKEYSDTIGESIFSSLENGTVFKNMDSKMQETFSNLKKSLDFSDIRTEDQLLEVEMSLNNLMKSIANGDVDLEKLTKSLEKANTEFAKTGNAEKYSKAIDDIIASLEKSTGKDFSMLKDVFKGVDTSILKGKDALDEFLRAYGKTKADIEKDDGFAKALANQKRQLEQVWDELNNITGKAELDLELAYNIVNNNELPQELRDMVRVLINKNFDPTEILKITQEIVFDLSEGKINIDEANQKIKEKFGEGAFEISPNIMLSDDTKVAGVETVIKQLEERFGELPTTVKTVIEAEGITAFNSAKDVKEMYDEIPKEIKTTMKNNGQDSLRDIILINDLINTLPSEVVTDIVGNYPDVLSEAKNIKDIIENLPSSVLMDINSNYPEVAEKLGGITDALSNIPPTVESKVSVKEEIQNDSDGFFSKIFKKKDGGAVTANAILKTQVQGEQALIDVDNRIASMTENGKVVKLEGDETDVANKTDQAQKDVDGVQQTEPVKLTADTSDIDSKLEVTKGKLKEIKSKEIKLKVITEYKTSGTPTPQAKQQGFSLYSQPYIPEPQVLNAETPSDKISLLSDSTSAENLANTDVQSRARATISTPIAIAGSDIDKSMKYSINLLQELENRIDSVSSSLSILDKKAKEATGTEKINYLQQQNVLYQEQLQLQKDLEDKLNRQKNYYEYFLKSKGFTFTSDGNLKNYEEKLMLMEQEADRLDSIAEAKQKAYSDYKGDNESTKNSLSSAYDKAKDSADKYKESLSTIKKYLDEYINVAYTELPKVAEEFLDINSAIKENIEAINEFNREIKDLRIDSGYKDHERDIKEIQNKLDLNEIKFSNAKDEERNQLLEERIELYKQLQKENQDLLKYEESLRNDLMKDLNQYGFKFRDNGSIEGYTQIIENLKKSLTDDEFERVFEKIEEYLDKTYETIPELEREWLEFNNQIKDTSNEINNLKKELDDLYTDSRYKDNERDIWEVQNKLDKNEIALQIAQGKKEIALIKEKIALQQQLQKEQKDLLEFEKQRRQGLINELSQYGFHFRNDGSIEGYTQKIEQLKKTLSEDEFDLVFSKIEDYLDTTYQTIPDIENEWEELNNSIIQHRLELEKLELESNLSHYLNRLQEINNEYDKISDRLDIIDTKLDNAYGKDKLDLFEEQIRLLKEQMNKQKELESQYNSMLKTYQNTLSGYGFKFNGDGDFLNLSDILNKLRDSTEIEHVKEIVEEYLDIQRDKLPDVQKEWEKLNSTIKNAYKEQLNTAKEIEDKILEVYKKQLEERKSLIDEELKYKVDALKKQKDAYNEAREEAEYNRKYEDQLATVEELQKKLDIAMKDNSLSGQKKVQDLLAQLKEEQEKLQDLVQDRLDDQVNDMFDKEQSRLEEDAEKLKETLDEEFSEERLNELIKNNLLNGTFTDLDGNIRNLQDVLLEFEDKFGDGMSIVGSLIKSELITNLEIAKDAMKDLGNIMKELDLGSLARSSYSQIFGIDSASRSIAQTYNNTSSSAIQFNSPLINIEGSVDSGVMNDLKTLSKEIEEAVTKAVVQAIR